MALLHFKPQSNPGTYFLIYFQVVKGIHAKILAHATMHTHPKDSCVDANLNTQEHTVKDKVRKLMSLFYGLRVGLIN